jgi:hypothetical protein
MYVVNILNGSGEMAIDTVIASTMDAAVSAVQAKYSVTHEPTMVQKLAGPATMEAS